MRKILIGVAVLLIAGTAWAAPTMSLSSDKASVAPGEVFTVTLNLQTDVGLIGWNAKFLDPAGFAVVPSYLVGGGWDPAAAPEAYRPFLVDAADAGQATPIVATWQAANTTTAESTNIYRGSRPRIPRSGRLVRSPLKPATASLRSVAAPE